MNIDFAPTVSASQSAALVARSDVRVVGTITQRAPSNRSASAESGPVSVFPAIGCAPTKPSCAGRSSSTQRSTSAFVDPVSMITESGPTTGAISSSILRMASSGVARIIRSAPSTACCGVCAVASIAPTLRARCATSG